MDQNFAWNELNPRDKFKQESLEIRKWLIANHAPIRLRFAFTRFISDRLDNNGRVNEEQVL